MSEGAFNRSKNTENLSTRRTIHLGILVHSISNQSSTTWQFFEECFGLEGIEMAGKLKFQS